MIFRSLLTCTFLGVAAVAQVSQTEEQREEERRRQKAQEDRARVQMSQARLTVARIEGKVLMPGGGPPPDRVTITLACGNQALEKQYTDSKGSFSLSISSSFSSTDASTSGVGAHAGTTANGCHVQAALPGYRAEPAVVENAFTAGGQIHLRIPLYATGATGYTYSATSLSAPREAKKAYEKGLQLFERKRLADAEVELKKAVEIHPRYAIAWYLLGQIHVSTQRPADARRTFEQAIAADGKYFNPYPMLAKLDLEEHAWRDLAQHTGTAIQLNPLFSIDQYLFNAQANLKLGRLDAAEKSAREAVAMDTQRKLPVGLRLLGAILAAQGRNREAADQLRAFLRAVPSFPEATAIQTEIERLEQKTHSSSK